MPTFSDLSLRKQRLLACACTRRVWEFLTDGGCRGAVETAERYADGQAGGNELERARTDANTIAEQCIAAGRRTLDVEEAHIWQDVVSEGSRLPQTQFTALNASLAAVATVHDWPNRDRRMASES